MGNCAQSHLAVDPVHDPDFVGRLAIAQSRNDGSGISRWRWRLDEVPLHDRSAHAPLLGTGRAVRQHLSGSGIRRGVHAHSGRIKYDQPAVCRLQDLLLGERLRPGLRAWRHGRYRNHHHRLVHAASFAFAIQRNFEIGQKGQLAMTTLTVSKRAHRRVARRKPRARRLFTGIAAWGVTFIFVAPIIWMVLTALHKETDAATNPPSVFAPLTLDGLKAFFGGAGLSPWPPLLNSMTASVLSVIFVLVLAFPAAFALSIRPVEKWRDVMFFFLTTKMLPIVAALLPLYLFAKAIGGLDNIYLLSVFYTVMNLPIAIWMLQSFLSEVPIELMEAAQLDGAGMPTILRRVIFPVATPGIAATALICFIFSWNDLLFARVLTGTAAGTAPVFLTGFVSSQGLFLATVSAGALVVSLPVIAVGVAAQDKLVQGLTFGAVK